MSLKSIEKDKWLSGEEGRKCVSGKAEGKFLTNRIDATWDAAWDAATANNQTILGALDTLGAALAEHGHTWTDGQRAIYEQAVAAVKQEPLPSEDA